MEFCRLPLQLSGHWRLPVVASSSAINLHSFIRIYLIMLEFDINWHQNRYTWYTFWNSNYFGSERTEILSKTFEADVDFSLLQLFIEYRLQSLECMEIHFHDLRFTWQHGAWDKGCWGLFSFPMPFEFQYHYWWANFLVNRLILICRRTIALFTQRILFI